MVCPTRSPTSVTDRHHSSCLCPAGVKNIIFYVETRTFNANVPSQTKCTYSVRNTTELECMSGRYFSAFVCSKSTTGCDRASISIINYLFKKLKISSRLTKLIFVAYAFQFSYQAYHCVSNIILRSSAGRPGFFNFSPYRLTSRTELQPAWLSLPPDTRNASTGRAILYS